MLKQRSAMSENKGLVLAVAGAVVGAGAALLPTSGHAQVQTTFSSAFQGGAFVDGADLTGTSTGILDWGTTAGTVTVQTRPSGNGTEIYFDGSSLTGTGTNVGEFMSSDGYQSNAGRYIFNTRFRVDELELLDAGGIDGRPGQENGFSYSVDDGSPVGGLNILLARDGNGRNSIFFYNEFNDVTRRIGTFTLGETLSLSLQIRSNPAGDRMNIRQDGNIIWRGDVDFRGGTANPLVDFVSRELGNDNPGSLTNKVALFRYDALYNPEPGLVMGVMAGGVALMRRRRQA